MDRRLEIDPQTALPPSHSVTTIEPLRLAQLDTRGLPQTLGCRVPKVHLFGFLSYVAYFLQASTPFAQYKNAFSRNKLAEGVANASLVKAFKALLGARG